MRRAIICCKQRLPSSFPNSLCRHPYLSLRYYSSTEGHVTEVRSRLNVVNILEERGLLQSLTSESLRSVCSDPNHPPVKAYCLSDPTTEGLHLGNLLGIIVLSWFLRCGHEFVAVRMLDLHPSSMKCHDLNALSRILDRIHFELLDSEWWDSEACGLYPILRHEGEIGTMGELLSKKSVRKKLESEQGMSCIEFTNELIQVYDFVELFRRYGCDVQIGGSDQWDSMTIGIDLIRRILEGEGEYLYTYGSHPQRAYGLTFPPLLKSDGTDFGKSEDGGSIWLSSSRFYQHLLSVPNSDVLRFLKMLTFLSMEEIAQIETEMQKAGYVLSTVFIFFFMKVVHFYGRILHILKCNVWRYWISN